MATITELQDRLAVYRAAETRILTGAQETSVGDQRARQAELANIQSLIRELENRIALAQASQGGLRLTHSTAQFRVRR